MTQEDRRLRYRVFCILEQCFKKRGLIKKVDGLEQYLEGAESLMTRLIDEVHRNYLKEMVGKKDRFLTISENFESAVRTIGYRRSNNLYRKLYLDRIYKRCSAEEYTVSAGYSDPFDRDSGRLFDIAKMENATWFGETMSPFNRTADSILEEKELMTAFDRAAKKLLDGWKDGILHYRTIEFYFQGLNQGLTKRSEISALSAYLGVSRKKTISLKFWARRRLFNMMSQVVPLDECRRKMKHKNVLKSRFKKTSIDRLLAEYRDVT